MEPARYRSWGLRTALPQKAVKLWWRSSPLPPLSPADSGGALPYGNGRSYGDVCLNPGGTVLDCRELNRLIEFDPTTGVLRCEAGVLLSDILSFAVPRGWFLPVTPGTRFVTVGGAIANDVHGKNHHNAGTFGCHVSQFELLRSDGSRLLCSRDENANWYAATIGGLGLTGLITWAEILLKPIRTPFIDQETIRFTNLSEFRLLADESDDGFQYTVAWIDCLARGASLGRGLFFRGNHSQPSGREAPKVTPPRIRVPISLPFSLVNHLSVRLFNAVYYRKALRGRTRKQVHFAPFFYPLDSVRDWNRIYGAKGFFQYQCVIPTADAEPAIREILERIAQAREGSFLVVLKRFGDIQSPGLLSFPREGFTLALDFPNRGTRTLDLLDRLDEVTTATGGAVNPSKDARMSPETFRHSFPGWTRFLDYIDPSFSSAFWRRVTNTGVRHG
jgi:FAD/FMN-containing dehydrogenase